MSILCSLGQHEWKKAYTSSGSCEVKVCCARCGKSRGAPGVEHRWVWQELDPCSKQEVCERCGVTRHTTTKPHSWSTAYLPESYRVERKCTLCGTNTTSTLAIASFVGQEPIKANLFTMIAAAQLRQEALPHLLLCGPPGVGKMKLARLAAEDMQVDVHVTAGPYLGPPGELAATLTNLQPRDILIIEDVDTARKSSLDLLAPAMESFQLDIIIGKGPSERSISMKLPRFTIIATAIKPPRALYAFIQTFRFDMYRTEELGRILCAVAAEKRIAVDERAALLISQGSDGTVGHALRLLKRAHDFAIVRADGAITEQVAREALTMFGPVS